VHDEITLKMPEAEAQEAATGLKIVMQQAGHTDLGRVPVEVAVVMAQAWTKTEAPAPRRAEIAAIAHALQAIWSLAGFPPPPHDERR
jgi:hypothetical protein